MIEERFDICECGDYRHQHENGLLTCTLCGDEPGGWFMCRQFRLHKRMVAKWVVVR